jgi:ABC-type phosphate transport system substrate-binding protein
MRRCAGLLFVLIAGGFLAGAFSLAADLSPGVPPEPPAPSELNLAIVVNISSSIENLSMTELRKIFLGERSHWPNGRRITLVMMEPGQPERAAVISLICQMNESDFKNHFLHGLFTGDVLVSPKTLATPVGVRKFIFNVPGAIGYLRATDVDASVKVIRVDERLPEDKGYKLHLPPRSSK